MPDFQRGLGPGAQGCPTCKEGDHAHCVDGAAGSVAMGWDAEDPPDPAPFCPCYRAFPESHDRIEEIMMGKASAEDPVNQQHLRAMGIDPASLGAGYVQTLDRPSRCTSIHPTEVHLQCAREAPHSGSHARRHLRWSQEEQSDEGAPTKQRPGDQELPEVNDQPGVQDLVIADIEARKQVGIERYGTVLQPFNGRKTLVDAYEESLDQTVYLRSLVQMQRARRETLVAVAANVLEARIAPIFKGATGLKVATEMAEAVVDSILDAVASEATVKEN